MALDSVNKRYSAVNLGSPWRGLNYLPTGTIDAPERLAIAFLGSSIAAEAPVEVPDVTGETQVAGTTTLEGEGFVVAVETAYSDSVVEGLIISQSPVGGSFAANGSTVTITVSLGPEPQEQEGGGGPDPRKLEEYWYWLEKAKEQLRQQQARRERDREQIAQIKEETDREIAKILKEDQEAERQAEELSELRAYVEHAPVVQSQRMRDLIRNAVNDDTDRALAKLRRVMAREAEDEEAIVVALLMLG